MADSIKSKYKIPDGLKPLLESLTREILRIQPDDLISFSQLFFNELQIQRSRNNSADIIKDPVLYEKFKVSLISKYISSHRDSKSHSVSPFDTAATKIQAAFRGHRVRVNPEEYRIDSYKWPKSRSSELLLETSSDKNEKRCSVGAEVPKFDEEQAATKIQSEIRRFLAKKQVENMKKENNDAAVKIQSHIRGYLTRKHLGEEGITIH